MWRKLYFKLTIPWKKLEPLEHWKNWSQSNIEAIITLNWYCNTTSSAKGLKVGQVRETILIIAMLWFISCQENFSLNWQFLERNWIIGTMKNWSQSNNEVDYYAELVLLHHQWGKRYFYKKEGEQLGKQYLW